MTTEIGDPEQAATWSIVLSVLMMGAGLVAIAAPAVAGVTVTMVFAWLLIASGLLHFAYAWNGDGAGAPVWETLVGMAYGGIGIYLLAAPVAGLVSLTLAIAVYLLIRSALEFGLAFQMRTTPAVAWLLLDGLVTLVLAAMIWDGWPSNSIWAIGTVVGAGMFFSGVTRVMVAVAARRTAVT